MNQPARDQPQIAQAARTIALQMLEERRRGAVLVGVARVDVALKSLLQAALLPATGSTDTFSSPIGRLGPSEHGSPWPTATLTDPSHAERLGQAYAAGRSNPLWPPLERILQEKVIGDGTPLNPGSEATGPGRDGRGSTINRRRRITAERGISRNTLDRCLQRAGHRQWLRQKLLNQRSFPIGPAPLDWRTGNRSRPPGKMNTTACRRT